MTTGRINQVTMVQNETVWPFLAMKLGSTKQFHPQQCAEAQGVYLQTISRFKLFYLTNPESGLMLKVRTANALKLL
jgi:hypothetical protein